MYLLTPNIFPRYAPTTMCARKLSVMLFSVVLCASSVTFSQQGAATPMAGAHGESQASPAPIRDELSLLADSGRKSVTLSAVDLRAMPHISVTIHNPHTNADETYSGVRLSDLLARIGAPSGKELRGKALADYIVATGSDGYKAVLALGEVDPSFHPGEVLVADKMNDKPLDEHTGPFRLVVTEDRRPARSVRNLISVELKSAL